VLRCNESLPEDIKELLTRIKCSPKSALQIFTSTDVARFSQLLVPVRYCFKENIQKEFMFLLPLSKRCTGSNIFKAVNYYFTADDISYANCVGICRDRAAALKEHTKDLQDEVQQINPHMNFIHCHS
jgi:hypothetical protein